MKQMCLEAGVSGKKTNHSLRATGASALFNAGVPERMIRDVTGHRSSALLQYERPNLEQKQAVSQILVQGGKGNTPASSTSPASTSPIPPVRLCAGPGPFPQPSSIKMGSVFNNCNITISPQHLVINNNVAANEEKSLDTEALLQGIDLDDLCD